MRDVAPDAADIATSLFSGIFNIGIGGGAFLGSMISGSFGFHPVTFVGSGLVTVSALLCLTLWIRTGSALFPIEKVATNAVQPAANRTLADQNPVK